MKIAREALSAVSLRLDPGDGTRKPCRRAWAPLASLIGACVLLGVMITVVIRHADHQAALLAHGTKAAGSITRIDLSQPGERQHYSISVEYLVAGRPITGVFTSWEEPPDVVGQQVTVYYEPRQPTDFRTAQLAHGIVDDHGGLRGCPGLRRT